MSKFLRRPRPLLLASVFALAAAIDAASPASACWFHGRRCRPVQQCWTCQPPPPPPPPVHIDYCQVLRKFKDSYVFDSEYDTPEEAARQVGDLRSRGYEAECSCYSGSELVCTCG
jgi:hypothetical protein